MPTKFGQNFLINKSIAQRIVTGADLTSADFVLEIGPGKGILTEEMAKCAGKVVAVEIDKNLVEFLKNKFKNQENVEFVENNILKINLSELLQKYSKCHSERTLTLRRRKSKNLMKSRSLGPLRLSEASKLGMTRFNYKVIANLPYYITSPIIRMFLESEFPPSEMVLMVQKEVAERITARPGKMSILSVAVQYYARPEILFYVGRENFDPVPEVDGAVIHITRNMQHETSNREFNKRFFKIVRAGFCAKRKILANNLANSFHLEKKETEEKIKAVGISPTARAQELSIEDWKKISELF